MAFIRFLMIIIGLALIGSAVGAVAFAPQLEPYARRMMEAELGGVLGTQVEIGKLRPAWMEGGLALENVTIHNPPDFKGGAAAECSRVLIQPEMFTVFSKSPTIACVTLEGAALRLRYKPGDGTNLGYLKKQASTAAAADAKPDEGLMVKEVRAPRAKVDLVPYPAINLNVKPLELGAIGMAAQAPGSAAKTVAGLMDEAMKQSTALGGMMQPLVEMLKTESATAGAAPATSPAPAPAPPAVPAQQEAAKGTGTRGPQLDIPDL